MVIKETHCWTAFLIYEFIRNTVAQEANEFGFYYKFSLLKTNIVMRYVNITVLFQTTMRLMAFLRMGGVEWEVVGLMRSHGGIITKYPLGDMNLNGWSEVRHITFKISHTHPHTHRHTHTHTYGTSGYNKVDESMNEYTYTY